MIDFTYVPKSLQECEAHFMSHQFLHTFIVLILDVVMVLTEAVIGAVK